MTPDPRVPLALVSGLAPSANTELAELLRVAEPGTAVVRLDEAMEPEPVSWAIRNVLVGDHPVHDDVDLRAVLTVVDCATWLADATGDDALAERNLQAGPEDDRTVAQVALAQVEFADVLVLAGAATDAWGAAKASAVLDRIAPSIPRVELGRVDGHSVLDAVPADARRGEATDMHGALLDGVVRTRGRAWVASPPEVAFWIESAGGGLGIGHTGPWLAAPDGPEWTDVSPERRTLASLRWHPVHGDRAQELVVVTDQTTPDEIDAALRGALLTDEELAAGPGAWERYPDPFGGWHEESCEDTETDPARHDATAVNRKEDR